MQAAKIQTVLIAGISLPLARDVFIVKDAAIASVCRPRKHRGLHWPGGDLATGIPALNMPGEQRAKALNYIVRRK